MPALGPVRLSRTWSLRTSSRAKKQSRRTALTRHAVHHLITCFAMVGARHNVLAFSCEAANAMRECSHNVARLRLLQRPVRPSPTYELELPRKPRCLHSATSLPRIAQARGAQPEESIAISLPTSGPGGPAQARGDQPEQSIAISLARYARNGRVPVHPAVAHRAPTPRTHAALRGSWRAPAKKVRSPMFGRGLTSWRSVAKPRTR